MSLINKIKEKFNSVFVRYTSPILITNRAANLDSSYGPYELPTGVTTPTVDLLDASAKATLYPGKTFGIIINGQVVEYWAQLKDSVISSVGFNFEEAVEHPENYDLIIKQCIDVESITPNLISVDKTSIDALFDDDETNPSLGSEWQPLPGEEQGATGGTEE